jgi:hypothetical protein
MLKFICISFIFVGCITQPYLLSCTDISEFELNKYNMYCSGRVTLENLNETITRLNAAKMRVDENLRALCSRQFSERLDWLDLRLSDKKNYTSFLEDQISARNALTGDLNILIRIRCIIFPFFQD